MAINLYKKAAILKKFVSRVKTEYINSRTMEAFIKQIKGKIDVVIDVRYNTFFKRDFSPRKFKVALEANKIEYEYIQDLGNPYYRKFKEDFRKAKRAYLNYLRKNVYIKSNKAELLPCNSLESLFKKIAHKKDCKTKVFCLICYCDTENPALCHRFWLKEALINRKRKELGMSENYVLEPLYPYEEEMRNG
jgi:uncharacterized protein (DUF488 family)